MSFYIRNSLTFMSLQIICHELYIFFQIIYKINILCHFILEIH